MATMPDRFRARFPEPSPPPESGVPEPGLLRRLGWFVALCAAGVAVTAGLAYALRALLFIG